MGILPENNELDDIIVGRAVNNGSYAIAYALLRVAEALEGCSFHLKMIGTGDAATMQGGLELVAQEIKNGSEAIASAMTPLTVQKYEDV